MKHDELTMALRIGPAGLVVLLSAACGTGSDSGPDLPSEVRDSAGVAIVQEYRFPEQNETIWTVFDADGRVQGLVETPPDLEVFEIGEDHILGTTTDELGVERVQLWPLDRATG